ncbi:internal scaffolding protein [Microviridae sp.]|nr:internal scaffolding protein [Microviridae sp.]
MSKQSLSIRKPYDPSLLIRVSFPTATMAKQSFKAECDINNIMKKYQATGLITHTQKVQGAYGDFTNVTDYHSSINRVNEAHAAFMQLPAKIRKHFDNDPAQMLAFIDDPSNYEKAVELGLLPKTSDIAAEGGQSKPAEPLKAVEPKGSKSSVPEDGASTSDGQKQTN